MVSGGEEDVRLNEGDPVFVLSSGSYADGQWWFQVAIAEDRAYAPRGLEVGVGWVAGGTAADPWIGERPGLCHGAPTLATIVAASRIERIGCSGGAPLTFDAYQAALSPDGGLGGACGDEPTWLVCDNINYDFVNADGGTTFALQLHFDPARGIAPTGLAPVGTTGQHWRITGHFDDPAAVECPADGLGADDALSARLTCASAFVVEAIQPLD
jgi:hypothetical protein